MLSKRSTWKSDDLAHALSSWCSYVESEWSKTASLSSYRGEDLDDSPWLTSVDSERSGIQGLHYKRGPLTLARDLIWQRKDERKRVRDQQHQVPDGGQEGHVSHLPGLPHCIRHLAAA